MTAEDKPEDFLLRLRGGVEQVTERCSFCSFVVVARFDEAREAFEQHVCDRPRPTSTQTAHGRFSLR